MLMMVTEIFQQLKNEMQCLSLGHMRNIHCQFKGVY